MAVTPEFLSASTDGAPIAITATATAGTLVHTAHATAMDRIWLWVTNVDTVARVVKVEFGTVLPAELIVQEIPAGSTQLLIAGVALSNSKTCAAFVPDGANLINVYGNVNRMAI